MQYNDNELHNWELKLGLTQSFLFSAMKQLAERTQGHCPLMLGDLAQQWFSGYDFRLMRLLPDGNVCAGGLSRTDAGLRRGIVKGVNDALKTRVNVLGVKMGSRYRLTLEEYEHFRDASAMYLLIEMMLVQCGGDRRGFNANRAMFLCTEASKMMDAMGAIYESGSDEPCIGKGWDEADYESCAL
jgi:hypothetical protein